MASMKPKTVIGDYIWTGYKWVRKAERTAAKLEQKRFLDQQETLYYARAGERTTRSLGPLASYPGQRAPAMRKPISGSAPAPDKTSTYDYSRRPARPVNGSPKTTTTSTPGASTSTGKGSGKRLPTRKVLQQDTMWVKAADSKTGKGYLAQKGKPEKRVTARVKIQEATTSGKAAGSTYAYKAGKTVKKVGKK